MKHLFACILSIGCLVSLQAQTISIDARQLPAGVYLLRVQAGNVVRVQRVVKGE